MSSQKSQQIFIKIFKFKIIEHKIMKELKRTDWFTWVQVLIKLG